MAEIVLECMPDETLIRTLGYKRKSVTHQPCRGEVINYIKKNPRNIIGIVDEDPGSPKPTYFNAFRRETTEKHGLESYIIKNAQIRLIVIKPRLEEWILKQAASTGINPSDHSFPENGKELHKIIHTRLPQFEGFITAMLKQKSAGLRHLQTLIEGKF